MTCKGSSTEDCRKDKTCQSVNRKGKLYCRRTPRMCVGKSKKECAKSKRCKYVKGSNLRYCRKNTTMKKRSKK